MLNRRTLLLGVVGIGAVALIADRSFLPDATAMTAELAGVVEDAQQASAIARTLQSGDPVQIQDLLNRLVTDEGADPELARPNLFGASAASAPGGDRARTPDHGAAHPAAADGVADTVSMIITTRNGGLAIVNGVAMRQGETVGGVTLLAVHPDRVVLSGRGGDRAVHMPGPTDTPIGPSVAAASPSGG